MGSIFKSPKQDKVSSVIAIREGEDGWNYLVIETKIILCLSSNLMKRNSESINLQPVLADGLFMWVSNWVPVTISETKTRLTDFEVFH